MTTRPERTSTTAHPPTPDQQSHAQDALAFALIVAVGLIVLFLRNPDPILNPALYGEDASWTSKLLHDRFGAYAEARPDYLVLAQILLLDLARGISVAATGGTLAVFPQAIALVSFAFWASLAALSFFAFRGWMSVRWRLAVVAAILLLPLGDHANEVLGRVLNLGYLFLPLAFVCCLLRERTRSGAADAILVLVLTLCIFTNPLAAPVIGAHLALRLWRRHRYGEAIGWLGDALLVVALAAFSTLFVIRAGEGPVLPDLGFAWDHLIEFTVARSVLYPFIFPFYQSFSDGFALLALAALGAAFAVALWRSGLKQRLLGLGLLCGLVGTTLVVSVTRPYLSNLLTGYEGTFPDRYFIAQNIFAIMLAVWSLSRLPRLAASAGAVFLTTLAVVGTGRLFEFPQPRMEIALEGPFREQLERALIRRDQNDLSEAVVADAYPRDWSVAIPTSLALATAAHGSHETSAASPVPPQLDLGSLPQQWSTTFAASKLQPVPLPQPALNELDRIGDRLGATGRDPYLAFDLSADARSNVERPVLSFAFDCEGTPRFVQFQLFWTSAGTPAFDEAHSLFFLASPGRNVVLLDAHPAWPIGEALTGLRLDINQPRACAAYGIDDVALSPRP